jgi:hypothetical protein
MTCGGQSFAQFFFQLKATVIGGDPNAHVLLDPRRGVPAIPAIS